MQTELGGTDSARGLTCPGLCIAADESGPAQRAHYLQAEPVIGCQHAAAVGQRVADAGYACRLGQPGTCGGSASSGIQILGRRDRRGDCQSKGCSTAWRMRPNHQCARFNCRARDRGGPLLGRCSKPSCNCPLGMRNLCFGMLAQRMSTLTTQGQRKR